jgi:hypothetical protein|tara:strand:+ start:84 stop:281 length:198 start_codon:yes stop_codon:yes gene_type:complete
MATKRKLEDLYDTPPPMEETSKPPKRPYTREVKETCEGCRNNEGNQHCHMGKGGCMHLYEPLYWY